ncbi:MAG: hypothetical protein IJ770_01575 [Alphaproteobacteria bacterium]|nr:hypothetical protein [Alphaproteobacteria bacterium]
MASRHASFLLNNINARINEMKDDGENIKIAEQTKEHQREDERLRLQQRQREEERTQKQQQQRLQMQKQSNTREERQDFDKNRQNQRTMHRTLLRNRIKQRVYG